MQKFCKKNFLHSHFHIFPPNLGMVDDDQGERFHKHLKKKTLSKKMGLQNVSRLLVVCDSRRFYDSQQQKVIFLSFSFPTSS